MPDEPVLVEPDPPKGLSGLFGKKKHAEAVAAAQSAFATAHESWRAEAAAVPGRQLEQMQKHDADERTRLEKLAQARETYRLACEERDADASTANGALDELIHGLRAGTHQAVQEYVGIVLGNSVYPESFPVGHEFVFDSELGELVLTALVPPPGVVPVEKEYRYVKAKDEITATAAPKRDLKERYAEAVYRVALRTLHEVFEVDRAGHIATIALTVATEGIDPATGLNKRTDLIAVGADRTARGMGSRSSMAAGSFRLGVLEASRATRGAGWGDHAASSAAAEGATFDIYVACISTGAGRSPGRREQSRRCRRRAAR